MQPPTDSRLPRRQVYDIVLASRPPDSLRMRFPTMSIRGTETYTALRRRVSTPGQLEDLLETLCSLGLPLLDVHRLPGTAGEQQTYEVRVDGEVGQSLLRSLSWSHRVVSGQIRVRIAAATSELLQFLRACSETGAGIQRVRLVSAGRHPTAT